MQLALMDTLLQDLRYALRGAKRNPWFTAAAIAALTLGIGVNTAIFSVINAVLLESLPYPDPDRIVVFTTTAPRGFNPMASPIKYNAWRQPSEAFEDVSAVTFNTVSVSGQSPEEIAVGQVSTSFFHLIGASILAGRTFTAA